MKMKDNYEQQFDNRTYSFSRQEENRRRNPVSSYLRKQQLSCRMLMMIFLFGGIFGFIYEEIFYLVEAGQLMKRGMTFGPWIPVYGFGALFIVLIGMRFRESPLRVFLVSFFASGLLEYLTGYVLYTFGRIRLWDYNTEKWNFGNIGGYVCLRSVLFFGLSGLMLVYFVCPLLMMVRRCLKTETFTLISAIPAALFMADFVISGILLWQNQLRTILEVAKECLNVIIL